MTLRVKGPGKAQHLSRSKDLWKERLTTNSYPINKVQIRVIVVPSLTFKAYALALQPILWLWTFCFDRSFLSKEVLPNPLCPLFNTHFQEREPWIENPFFCPRHFFRWPYPPPFWNTRSRDELADHRAKSKHTWTFFSSEPYRVAPSKGFKITVMPAKTFFPWVRMSCSKLVSLDTMEKITDELNL